MASSFESELKRKTVAAEEAAALVKSGDWIDYGFGIGQPDVFDQALAARIPQLTGVKIRGTLALKPRAVIEADPEGRHVAYFSWYFSGARAQDARSRTVQPYPDELRRGARLLSALR